jgi:ADP-ribosylglycohydrolase
MGSMCDEAVSPDSQQHLIDRYPLPSVEWPAPVLRPDPIDLFQDVYRGCLLWGAVGDALGRVAERKSPSEIRARFGPDGPTEYVPWRGWQGGPTGTITDDTQLTMEIARSIIHTRGQFDPEDFSRRLVEWLPVGRGKGRATTEAVKNLVAGQPWWRAGVAVNSAGNGSAMRAAPIGLAHAFRPTPERLIHDALLSSIPTHTHRVGVAGAIIIAAGVAWCVRESVRGAGQIDVRAYIDFVASTIDGLEQAPTPERRPGGGAVRLVERVREIEHLLTWDGPAQVFSYTNNGAFALESVPAALYCFLRTPDDPREVIMTAVRAGRDADTVASMAGNLAGAWVGAVRLRAEAEPWWSELEFRDELMGLADALAELTLDDRRAPGW